MIIKNFKTGEVVFPVQNPVFENNRKIKRK